MIKTPLRVLLIEEDEDDCLLVRDYLGETSDTMPSLEWAATYEAGRAALARREHDIVLVDYRLGAHSGLDLLRAADGTSDLPSTIILTGAGDLAVDAAAQTAGAFDFLVKGQLDASTLERAIRYTLDQSRQRVALAESQRFLQATLDALSAHIAVLDERGVIIAANAAWRRFVAQNDFPDGGYGLGMEYLAICDAGARDGADGASEIGAAIRDILAGRGTPFVREYPCHGPHERRWFAIRISRFPGDGPIRLVIAHENVTERHLAEEQTRFQAQLLDQVPAAVIATDPAGVVTHWNAHATTLYGWTPEETLGRSAEMLTAGPADAEWGRALLARVRAGEVWAGEFPVRRKDGTSFPAYVTDSAIRDEQGRFAGVVGVSVDISDRKVAEAALREQEEQFRYLFAHNPYPMWVYDVATLAFLEVNAAAVAHYGYTREEFLAMTLADIRPCQEHDRLLALFPVRRGDGLVPGVWPHLTKDGRTIEVELVSRTLEYGGRPARLVVAQDVTARQFAETALVASEARYRMLLEQASDGIVVMDPTARFVEVNAQACAMLGYAREELLVLGSPDVIDPADLATRPLVFPQSGPTPTVFERQLRRRDGTTFPAEASIKRLPDGGTQAILRDITARKAAEAELREVLTHARCLLWRAEITKRPGAELAPDAEQFSWSLYLADEAAAQHVLPLDVPPGGDYAVAWHQSRHAEDFARSDAISARALREGAPGYRQEFRCRNRHGGEQWLAEEVTLEASGPGRWRAVGICVDITARKTAEAELRANEARFRALVQHAGDLITLVAEDGTIRYESPSLERILGYRPAEREGRSLHELLHPDDLPALIAAARQLRRTSAVGVTLTLRLRHRDGSWRWLEGVATNLLADPAVGAIVLNSRDITARKDDEAALRRQNAHLAALGEAGRVLGGELDLDRALDHAWAQVARVSGVANGWIALLDEAMSALNYRDFVLEGIRHPEWQDRQPRGSGGLGWAVIDEARPLHVPDYAAECRRRGVRVNGPLGETTGVAWLGLPLLAGGRVTGALAVWRPDVPFSEEEVATLATLAGQIAAAVGNARLYAAAQAELAERVRAEGALRASEARLAAAQGLAHLGSWEADPATGETHWSDEAFRIFGLAPQGTAPSYAAFLAAVHPDDRARVDRAAWSTASSAPMATSASSTTARMSSSTRRVGSDGSGPSSTSPRAGPWRNGSSTRPSTTPSPACPTAPSSSTASTTPSPAARPAARRWACSSSTWTASSTSTTRSATPPGTGCSSPSPRACPAAACARATPSPASAATSSPWCWRAWPTRARRRASPRISSPVRYYGRPTRSRGARSPSMPASGSRSAGRVRPIRAACCGRPTPPSTAPRPRARGTTPSSTRR